MSAKSFITLSILCTFRRNLLLFAFFIFSLPVFAQLTIFDKSKSSVLLQQQEQNAMPDTKATFIISVACIDSVYDLIKNDSTLKIIRQYNTANLIVVKTNWRTIRSLLLKKQVNFVDVYRQPKEELVLNNLDISVNKINAVHSAFPFLNGSETVVSLKENLPDTNDIDIKNRYVSTNLSSTIGSTHASNMASIIAGAGNTWFKGKGVAWGASLSSASFDILLPENDDVYGRYNISVQNHSYGTGIENYYGADAAAYDASVVQRPELLHVFSSGNSGTNEATSGTYKGITGFANLTGSFKMAKNIITVGNVDSVYRVLPRSSKGPAFDGRIKPEVVAYAEDGSSGAAAIVSGISLLLQQAYKSVKGSLPPAALIKAVLINSADDVGPKGIDYVSGFGNVNALKSIRTIVENRYFNGTVGNNEKVSYNFSVPPGLKELKITMVWADTTASPNTNKALVNDLDMSLSLPALNENWLPWVLNTAANVDSLKQAPIRKRDSLNNIEQITITDPASGNYVLNITGYSVKKFFSQSYNIAYIFDSLNKFEWYNPSENTNFLKHNNSIIRWSNSFPDSTGVLKYKLDKENVWHTIDNTVILSRGYYNWNVPDITGKANLRIDLNNTTFTSKEFSISDTTSINVVFNCQDSVLLNWNKMAGVDSFRIFELGEKYMRKLKDTPDTSIIFYKNTNNSFYYSVCPLFKQTEGMRTISLKYDSKQVGCLITSFVGNISDNHVRLQVQVLESAVIKSVIWQKILPNSVEDLKKVTLNGYNYTFFYTDSFLTNGINLYRVKLELINGTEVFSDIKAFLYTGFENYSIFPNPVQKKAPITIISKDANEGLLQVFSSAGIKILEQKIDYQYNIVPTDKFVSGLYFFKLLKKGKQDKIFKVIVYSD
jgi:hypothetical protein